MKLLIILALAIGSYAESVFHYTTSVIAVAKKFVAWVVSKVSKPKPPVPPTA